MKSSERQQETAHQQNDRLNKVHDVRSYLAFLAKPKTGAYRVLPDGTVEFIREV